MKKWFLQRSSGALMFAPKRTLDVSLWRWAIVVGFALGLALAFGSAEHTGAQRDYGSCYSYATQEAAQAALNSTSDPIVMDILDHNDDGIACDNFDFAAGHDIDDGDAVWSWSATSRTGSWWKSRSGLPTAPCISRPTERVTPRLQPVHAR